MPSRDMGTYVGRSELFAGRYRLDRVLGRGGAATVHQALDERLGRQVAIKVFRQDADADLRWRFENEARLLAQLQHPGLVRIFDFGNLPPGPYLVLELLPGPPLHELLHDGPLSLVETLHTGVDLARTLAYVHGEGIVHRDLKPANILFDEDRHPRLADFGISRSVDTAGVTRTGTLLGTAAYLAPEQVRGHGAGPEADVYALGLVLIECLTAERQYPGTPVESAFARLQRAPRMPSGLPWDLAQALGQMTRTDPDRRITAVECAALLSSALDRVTESTPGPAAAKASLSEPEPVADTIRLSTPLFDLPRERGGGRRRLTAAGAAIVAGGTLAWGLVAAGGPAPVPPGGSLLIAGTPSTAPAITGPAKADQRAATTPATPSRAATARTASIGSAGSPGPLDTDAEADQAQGQGHGYGHGRKR